MIYDPLQDLLGPLHGKRMKDIYVIVSEDGSTLVRDPGLGRPWSSPNKQIAEHMATDISRKTGRKCAAVDLETALKSVLHHQKNLPKYLPEGFKLPDAP